MKAEMLLLSPSMRVPSLMHNGIKVWDTLAISEYLNEIKPKAGLLPVDAKARAHCRAISGEMHSGFSALRSALPMNIKGTFPNYKIWLRAQADVDHIVSIWKQCLSTYGGPYSFGAAPCAADAMYAPVVTCFMTYDASSTRSAQTAGHKLRVAGFDVGKTGSGAFEHGHSLSAVTWNKKRALDGASQQTRIYRSTAVCGLALGLVACAPLACGVAGLALKFLSSFSLKRRFNMGQGLI